MNVKLPEFETNTPAHFFLNLLCNELFVVTPFSLLLHSDFCEFVIIKPIIFLYILSLNLETQQCPEISVMIICNTLKNMNNNQ